MGRRSSHANRGKQWEARLNARHTTYQTRGLAVINKTAAEVKHLGRVKGKPGQFIACYAGKGPLDYSVMSGGYSIIADAKEFQGNRWGFALLESHQADMFERWQKQGGHGVLLISAVQHAQNFCVPWSHIRERWLAWRAAGGRAKRGEASLSIEDLDQHGIPLGRSADWLGPYLQYLRGTQ